MNTVVKSSSKLSGLATPSTRGGGQFSQGRRSLVGFRVYASDRPTWLPGAPGPAHLDGSLVGDYGFDPLGLGTNSDRLKWYQEAELMNARFAMLGCLGIMGAEVLGVPDKWWIAGAKDYDYPILPLVAVQAVVMGFLETKRYQGWKETSTTGLIDTFPFDPAGLLSEKSRLQEVKNGRLAMVAMFGFTAQAAVCGAGPIECWARHVSNPFGDNIITNVLSIQDNLTFPGVTP
jgi:light-harvesting complex I chlorophyll a/b binding protein 5